MHSLYSHPDSPSVSPGDPQEKVRYIYLTPMSPSCFVHTPFLYVLHCIMIWDLWASKAQMWAPWEQEEFEKFLLC